MSAAGVELVGIGTLRRSLRKAGVDLEDMRAINNAIASFVGATAAGRAPRRTGMLAAAWAPSNSKTQAAVRFGQVYAKPVHWGTGPRPGRRGPHNIAANRFATEAAAETEPTWAEMYRARVDEALGQVKGA